MFSCLWSFLLGSNIMDDDFLIKPKLFIFVNTLSRYLVCIAGLGFVTSLVFVFLVGVFVSSWLGSTVFWVGEWFIKRMPFMKHIYSASKQISAAISPGYSSSIVFIFACQSGCIKEFTNALILPYPSSWVGFTGVLVHFLGLDVTTGHSIKKLFMAYYRSMQTHIFCLFVDDCL